MVTHFNNVEKKIQILPYPTNYILLESPWQANHCNLLAFLISRLEQKILLVTAFFLCSTYSTYFYTNTAMD